ncbi:hypothetical protein ILYODFUR_007992 [Ilyodon furcidens]|uniref:Uncharacterized protein n=1 Tax=Ilyodon furcidens TaxID=33524 RepID=A0ABV0TVK7_9TELE
MKHRAVKPNEWSLKRTSTARSADSWQGEPAARAADISEHVSVLVQFDDILMNQSDISAFLSPPAFATSV